MTKSEFERLLDVCCGTLTHEARSKGFESSRVFENRVREVLNDLLADEDSLKVDFTPPPQEFPDIALGPYGVEVKFTLSDTWKSIANSILESQRAPGVKYIYIVFGKMGGKPEVRWGDYEKSVVHVRTSHVPRFEVELPATDGERRHESLFEAMKISYDEFSQLDIHEKMRYVREYAKKKHPGERLWWIDDSGTDEHTLPANIRLYTNLSAEEKLRLRAEAVLLCPNVLKSGRARNKYDDVVMFMLSYHGVLCHQARDLFSAGSVANPNNDDDGGLYIERALKLLEGEMLAAADRLEDALFVEYWGESVPKEKRIARWLGKADALASGWTPSKVLFLRGKKT
jgi:hypothetical protein